MTRSMVQLADSASYLESGLSQKTPGRIRTYLYNTRKPKFPSKARPHRLNTGPRPRLPRDPRRIWSWQRCHISANWLYADASGAARGNRWAIQCALELCVTRSAALYPRRPRRGRRIPALNNGRRVPAQGRRGREASRPNYLRSCLMRAEKRSNQRNQRRAKPRYAHAG